MASITGTAAGAYTGTRMTERAGRRRRFDAFHVATYLFLIFMVVIYIAPLIWMLLKSLMSFGESNSVALIPTELHPENYAIILSDSGLNFLRYLVNTILLEIMTVGGQTLICIMAAYGFARLRFPGRDLLFSMFLITIFIPSTVTLVPKLVMVTNISRFMAGINPSLVWLDNWPALVIPFLASTFSIFLLRQFFLQVPEELWDAARIDGAGHLRYLFTILVPISRAAVTTTVLLSFIGTWSAFDWPLLVVESDTWRPIGVALYQLTNSENAAQTHLIMAASVVALVPILILYFFAQRTFIEGIATTGLKG